MPVGISQGSMLHQASLWLPGRAHTMQAAHVQLCFKSGLGCFRGHEAQMPDNCLVLLPERAGGASKNQDHSRKQAQSAHLQALTFP